MNSSFSKGGGGGGGGAGASAGAGGGGNGGGGGSGEDQSYPQLDLSGKLIIKAQLGDDVRRIPIHNEAITYDELVLMMQRVFRGKLSSSDDITIKYKDEDGDLITIFDSSDLAFAVQYSRILKLQILVGGEESTIHCTQALQAPQVNQIRRELQSIRDQVNHLLDSIERVVEVRSSTIENRNNASEHNTVVSNLSSREFDPLQELARVRGSRNVDTKDEETQPEAISDTGRGSTPDSIGSSGSRQVSSGMEAQQTPQQQQQPPPQMQPPQQQPQQPPQLQQAFQPTGPQPQAQTQQLPTSQSYQPPDQPQSQAYQHQAYGQYPVQPIFMGGQVIPAQPPYSAYQTYPSGVQGYPPGAQKGVTSPGTYRPTTNPSPQSQPQVYTQDYSSQTATFAAPPRFPAVGLPPNQQPPTSSNPYSKGAGYPRPPSQAGY